jgi:formylglycine-generating enzyme required for sulfatase activity
MLPNRDGVIVPIANWRSQSDGWTAAHDQLLSRVRKRFTLTGATPNWARQILGELADPGGPTWIRSGEQLKINPTAGEPDRAAAADRSTAQLHAATWELSQAIVRPTRDGSNLSNEEIADFNASADRFVAAIKCETEALVEHLDDLWHSYVSLSGKAELYADRLPNPISTTLRDWLRVAAPFVRQFPKVKGYETGIAAGSVSEQLAEAVDSLLRAGLTERLLDTGSAADLLKKIEDRAAGKDADRKATVWATTGGANLLITMSGLLAAESLGRLPRGDKLLQTTLARVQSVLTGLHGCLAPLVRHFPEDLRPALETALQATARPAATPAAEIVENPRLALAAGQDAYGTWADFTVRNVTQRMRLIPKGSFLMGSPDDEDGRLDTEGPQQQIVIGAPFWLFDTPCTQALWQAVMGYSPSWFNGPDSPVVNVSFDDTRQFITKLNQNLPGLDLSLPSEALWEYACRAGTTGPSYDGDLDAIAWHGANSGRRTHSVKQKRPNHWGLFDMLGNVREWCADAWWGSHDGAAPNGVARVAGSALSARVMRGGAGTDDPRQVRAASRNGLSASYRLDHLGFRCAQVRNPRNQATA